MAEQDSKNPVAIITAVAAIFGASWWMQSTPTSSRPRLGGSAAQVLASAQDVPARLWQDPMRLATEHYNQALWSPNKDAIAQGRPKERLEELQRWLKPPEERNANVAKAPENEHANIAKASQDPNANPAESSKDKDKPRPSPASPNQSLVLIIMIPGGSAPERSELRLRIRQAVIHALGSELYRPFQGDNIGYFKLAVPVKEPPDSKAKPMAPPTGIVSAVGPVSGASKDVAAAPKPEASLLIPFECFMQPLPNQSAVESSSATSGYPKLNRICDKVGVLWLCDDLPGATAYQLLWETARTVGCVKGNGEIKDGFQLRILGPSSSEVLQDLWSDGGKSEKKAASGLQPEERFLKTITITSPFATVDAAAIQAFRLGLENRLTIPKVERTVHDDYVVCSELVRELTRRNVTIYGSGGREPDSGQNRTWHAGHIALLSEWDTFYGRVLPFTFRRALANDPKIFANKRLTDGAAGGRDPMPNAGKPIEQYEWLLQNQWWPQGLESFVYLRGLDGRPPTEDKQQRPIASSTQAGATSAERLATEGESQADFVDRLVGQLARRHDQLIRQGHGGFRAIGVLGSDVYDKLMLLRALRREFRGVVFFTNELDARFTLPEETQACRNLVIASPYGLNLKADYQHTIPQFRNSTQTAVFAAMLHLLGGVDVATSIDPAQPANKPRPTDLGTVPLFEIGLRGAVDLTIPTNTSSGLIHPERFAVKGPFEGGPEYRNALIWMGILGALLVAALFGVFYNSELIRVTTEGREPANEPGDQRGAKPEAEAAGDQPNAKPEDQAPEDQHRAKPENQGGGKLERVACVIRLLGRRRIGFIVPTVVAVGCYVWFMAHAEPDSEPFTLFDGTSSWQTIAVMTFAALFCAHLICRTELILYENDESLAREYHLDNPPVEEKPAKQASSLNQFLDWASLRWGVTSTNPAAGEALISACGLWLRYRFLGQFRFRVLRALLLTVIAFIGIWTAFQFSPPPPLPFRSPDGPPLIGIVATLGTVFLSTLLLFVVSDAVILGCGLIRRLDQGQTDWPGRGQRAQANPVEQNPNPQEDAAARSETEKKCWLWRDRMLAERSDISFIEKRTRAVGRITHYPFFMVALIFVARNRYFDDWAMPFGIIVTYILLLGTTIALSCWLNRSARAARDGSLARLGNLKTEVDNYCFANPDRRPHVAELLGQLNEVRDEIKGMRDGSYAPFWDQPAFRGILLGTGGWSLSTLLPKLSYLF